MIDFENIDLECESTWSLIGLGDTKGVFQLESRLGQSMAKKLKPNNIEQLAALISILRPGCISGDTKILIDFLGSTISMNDLYKNQNQYKSIVSYNEITNSLINNKILNLINSGIKECFRLNIQNYNNSYDLECTDDHKLLTRNGWIELKNIVSGTEILVLSSNNKNSCEWVIFIDKISVGRKQVYDISMHSPHHNFLAGGVVVHNCLEAVRDGKTVSNHYIDKKNGKESIDYFNNTLEPILSETFGEMVYQEQAMQICQKIANFNLSEADMLRKAIGKKKPEEMAKIKTIFIEKSKEAKIVNEDEADQIFGWIEKSQRYSFNKSHAVSYALNAYVSAYAKAHFPKEFFTSYLRFAKDKIDPMKEINELVNNAIQSNIVVRGPDFRKLNKDFELIDHTIYFGLTNVKGVGNSVYTKIIELTKNLDIKQMSLNEVLLSVLDKINSTASKNLVSVGAFDYIKISRKKILFYLDIISNLSAREKSIILETIDIKLNLADMLSLLIPRVNKKRQDIIISLIKSIRHPAYNLEDTYDWIANTEKQYLGVSITCSIIDGKNQENSNCDCQRLNKDKFLPKTIIVAAEITDINIVKTKRGLNPGQDMAFIKISDGTGSSDVVVFPKEYESIKNILYEGNTVMLGMEQSKDKESVFVKKCWQI